MTGLAKKADAALDVNARYVSSEIKNCGICAQCDEISEQVDNLSDSDALDRVKSCGTSLLSAQIKDRRRGVP